MTEGFGKGKVSCGFLEHFRLPGDVVYAYTTWVPAQTKLMTYKVDKSVIIATQEVLTLGERVLHPGAVEEVRMGFQLKELLPSSLFGSLNKPAIVA